MRWYKHWKWQCLLAAPLLPWFYIHYTDWLYDLTQFLGWGRDGGGVAVGVLTILATIVFIIGYVRLHDD